MYWQDRKMGEASALLGQAISDEHGRISDKADDEEDDKRATLYPTFKTAGERRQAALAKYRDVEARFAGTGAAILARLSEGGLLLDSGDAKGAEAAYSDVKGSPLAQSRRGGAQGRAASRGIGFADELLAKTSDEAAKEKHLDDALGAYRQLGAIDARGFKELGKFHEARVLQTKGDKAKRRQAAPPRSTRSWATRPRATTRTHPVLVPRARGRRPAARARSERAAPEGEGAQGRPDGRRRQPGHGRPAQIRELFRRGSSSEPQQGGGAPGAPGACGGASSSASSGRLEVSRRAPAGWGGGAARRLASVASCASTESAGDHVNPEKPLWFHQPSGAISVTFLRELTAPSRAVGEPYERGKAEIDPEHGRFFVGSSDHGLYALRASDGSTLWRFETLGPVQSEPLYDPELDVVFFGSHDGCALRDSPPPTGALLVALPERGSMRSRAGRPSAARKLFFANGADQPLRRRPADGQARLARPPRSGARHGGERVLGADARPGRGVLRVLGRARGGVRRA